MPPKFFDTTVGLLWAIQLFKSLTPPIRRPWALGLFIFALDLASICSVSYWERCCLAFHWRPATDRWRASHFWNGVSCAGVRLVSAKFCWLAGCCCQFWNLIWAWGVAKENPLSCIGISLKAASRLLSRSCSWNIGVSDAGSMLLSSSKVTSARAIICFAALRCCLMASPANAADWSYLLPGNCCFSWASSCLAWEASSSARTSRLPNESDEWSLREYWAINNKPFL